MAKKTSSITVRFDSKKLSPLRAFIILSDLPLPHKSHTIVIYCLLRSYPYNNKKTKGKFTWSNQHYAVSIFVLPAQNVNFKC
ncbi:hypothetical protein GG712_03690 [Salmonella enterica]|nr:hypothetical protein [Salmonella enterica]